MTPRQLIVTHLPLVRAVAYRLANAGLSMDDLCGYGVIGLCEAAGRFDHTRGLAFTTFAFHRIKGAMLDGIRLSLGGGRWGHLETGSCDDVDVQLVDFPSPEDELDRSRRVAALREAIAGLPERERALVEGVDLREESLDEARAALGMHKSWASRLRTRGLATLRERLEGRLS